MKINFITNICTHYIARLFELLGGKYDIDFYFTGGDEPYWNKMNKAANGKIRGHTLKGFYVLPRVKVVPGLFRVFSRDKDLYIKTLDGRFALPFSLLMAKFMKKPFVLWTGLWSHPQNLFHRLTFPVTKFVYRHSDALVVYGEHVKRYLVQIGIPPEKIFCAPHSTDNNLIEKPVTEEQKSALRQQLRLEGKRTVLYVGRFEKCKGLGYLIDGLAKMAGTSVTAVLVGNGSQEQSLREQCERMNVDCRIVNHVANEDLYCYYALADVFVLPSVTTKDFKEPWGIVVNEAMNQGCPVVTTDAVGAAAGGLVEDGHNGFIVPERDSPALKEAIEKILKDDHIRREFGQNAKQTITKWTPQRTMDGFVRAIEFAAGR